MPWVTMDQVMERLRKSKPRQVAGTKPSTVETRTSASEVSRPSGSNKQRVAEKNCDGTSEETRAADALQSQQTTSPDRDASSAGNRAHLTETSVGVQPSAVPDSSASSEELTPELTALRQFQE